MSLSQSCSHFTSERYFRDHTFSALCFNLVSSITVQWSPALCLNTFTDGELTITPKGVHSISGQFWDLELCTRVFLSREHLPISPSWTHCAYTEHVETLCYLVLLQILGGEPHGSPNCLASGTWFLALSLVTFAFVHLCLSFYDELGVQCPIPGVGWAALGLCLINNAG